MIVNSARPNPRCPQAVDSARPNPDKRGEARKRGPGRTLENLPPSETRMREALNFSTKTMKERYDLISQRSILVCRSIDFKALETLGIKKEVEGLVNQTGWKTLFDIECPTYTELIREFYTTFQFDPPKELSLDTPDVIKYRLMGRAFSQSITGFNLALGVVSEHDVNADWYINSKVGYGDFVSMDVWEEMSFDKSIYDPSQSSGFFLEKPEWKYVHRLLSFNFVGRKSGSATCSKMELYFIWAMAKNVHLNLGYWLANQFKKVLEKKKGLILGSLITHLAVSGGLLDLHHHSLHKAHDPKPLDLNSLKRMGIIEKKDETYVFTESHMPQPKVVRRQAKRARFEDTELVDDLESPVQSIPNCTFSDLMQMIGQVGKDLTEEIDQVAKDMNQKIDQVAKDVMEKLDQIAKEHAKMRADLNAFYNSQSFHPSESQLKCDGNGWL